MNGHAQRVHDAVAAVCPIDGVSLPIENDNTTWTATAKAEATVEQIAAGQAVLANWNFLEDEKQATLEQIDAEIKRRIHSGTGFEFPPGSGIRFSLSANAQIKWIGLAVGADFSRYPLRVPNIDDTAFFDIPDANTARALYAHASAGVRLHLEEGTAAKEAVRVAASSAEIAQLFMAYKSGG
jgi:hypothetical protein